MTALHNSRRQQKLVITNMAGARRPDASRLFKKESDTEQKLLINNMNYGTWEYSPQRAKPPQKYTNVIYMMVRDDILQSNPGQEQFIKMQRACHARRGVWRGGGGGGGRRGRGRTRCNICQITQLKTIISVIHLPGIHCLQRTSLSPHGRWDGLKIARGHSTTAPFLGLSIDGTIKERSGNVYQVEEEDGSSSYFSRS